MLGQKIIYVGRLDGYTDSDRRRLVHRIRSLLLLQYGICCSEKGIEEKAKSIAAKIHRKYGDASHTAQVKASDGGSLSLSEAQVSIRLNSIAHHSHYEVGMEWLCSQAIRSLGILDFLSSQLGWSDKAVGLFELALLARLIHRGSELSSMNWLEESSGSIQIQNQANSVSRTGLYNISKQALQDKSSIESFLYSQVSSCLPKSFNTAPNHCYYDLSNVYFHGRMQGSSLCHFGASKEKRMNNPLVTYSLLSDGAGVIKKSEFYAGNTYEAHTFSDVIRHLDKSQVFLCDSGISTKENIYYMLEKGYKYACVAKEGFKELQVDFTEEQVVSFQHHCSNGYEYQVWLTSRENRLTLNGKEYKEYLLFVKSEGKQIKEDGIIAKQKQRFEQGLLAIQASLSKKRGHKKITQVHQRIGKLKAKNGKVNKAFKLDLEDDGINVTSLKWTYDSTHEQRNGTYIIRTSQAIHDVKQTWNTYKALTEIEAVNRCLKTDLKIRPVYHQKDETIKAHFFMGFMAANVIKYIRAWLSESKIHHSWERILQIMNQQKTTITTFANNNNEWFWVCQWSQPNQQVKDIYDALEYLDRAHDGFFFQVQNRDG